MSKPIGNILVLASSDLWEFEVDTLARQSLVDFRVGIQAVVNATPLLLVQHHLQDLASILSGPRALANDLHWVDQVGEDGVVHSSECSRARSLLRLARAAAVAALRAREDAAGGDDEDVAVRELLLEFTGETELDVSWGTREAVIGRD